MTAWDTVIKSTDSFTVYVKYKQISPSQSYFSCMLWRVITEGLSEVPFFVTPTCDTTTFSPPSLKYAIFQTQASTTVIISNPTIIISVDFFVAAMLPSVLFQNNTDFRRRLTAQTPQEHKVKWIL